MTAMPTPAVELRFHPTDLDTETLRAATRHPGSPSQAIEAGLLTARMMVINQAKAEVAKISGDISAAKLIGAADIAWQLFAPRLVRSLGPAFAEEYLRTLRAAGAGDIPMATVYALAEQHASRIGTYYHESSRAALAGGFNTFVNRRIAERVAADRVLDGYGLTARGMAGYTSRSVDMALTVTPMKLKQRVLDYIGTSVRQRIKVFATQEEHNISQQAQQIAWMWLQDTGRISPNSQKIWITAKDERVCPQCGPMHGVKVLLGDRFTLSNGTEVWVPGMHPNCRCQVRLLTHPWMAEVGKAEEWNPKLHPRGGDPENPGRFSAKARSAPRGKPVLEQEDTTDFQAFLDTAERRRLLEEALDPPLEPKATLESKPTLGSMATLAGKATMGLPEKATLNATKATLGTVGTEAEKATLLAPARATLLTTLKQRALLRSSTEKAFLAYDEAAKRKPRAPEPNKRRRRLTRLVTDSEGKPMPVYYIAGPWEELDENGNIELIDEIEFTTDRDQAIEMALQEFDQHCNDTWENIVSNADNKITMTHMTGQKFEATVDDDDAYDVVSYAAHQGRLLDPDAQGDTEITVTWKEVDEDGNLIEDGEEFVDTVRASNVAEEWHLDPEQFDIKVLVLTEGHQSDRGKTWQANFKEKNGYDTWIATGMYHAEEANREYVGSSSLVKLYELAPHDPVIVDEDSPGVGYQGVE